jgi:hypothetical protein
MTLTLTCHSCSKALQTETEDELVDLGQAHAVEHGHHRRPAPACAGLHPAPPPAVAGRASRLAPRSLVPESQGNLLWAHGGPGRV